MRHRGTRGAYQRWADTVEDQSFTFDSLLPYFKKSPILTPSEPSEALNNGFAYNETAVFSPSGGPLHVSYSHYLQPFTPFIRSAFSKLGLKSIGGFNSGDLFGFASFSTTIDPASETRSSSETSFLRAAVTGREHILVYNHTVAQRILFDANRTATGVLVDTAGETFTLTARKEIIVAAGVVRKTMSPPRCSSI